MTAIDWSAAKSPRFTVVWHLLSTTGHAYVRIAADCADDAHPAMPSATGLWPGANWHEREAYDMFGIAFDGHPDLRRILMWDGYPYHPLRKEFPLAGLDASLPDADGRGGDRRGGQAGAVHGRAVRRRAGRTRWSEAEPRAKDESWSERREKPNLKAEASEPPEHGH